MCFEEQERLTWLKLSDSESGEQEMRLKKRVRTSSLVMLAVVRSLDFMLIARKCLVDFP